MISYSCSTSCHGSMEHDVHQWPTADLQESSWSWQWHNLLTFNTSWNPCRKRSWKGHWRSNSLHGRYNKVMSLIFYFVVNCGILSGICRKFTLSGRFRCVCLLVVFHYSLTRSLFMQWSIVMMYSVISDLSLPQEALLSLNYVCPYFTSIPPSVQKWIHVNAFETWYWRKMMRILVK